MFCRERILNRVNQIKKRQVNDGFKKNLSMMNHILLIICFKNENIISLSSNFLSFSV